MKSKKCCYLSLLQLAKPLSASQTLWPLRSLLSVTPFSQAVWSSNSSRTRFAWAVNTDRRGGNTHTQQEVYEKSFPNPAHSIVFQIMWLFIYCRILTENFNINPSSFTFGVMIVPEDCLEIPEGTWLIGGSFFLTRFWQGGLWGQHCAFCTSGTRAACRSCTYCPVFILEKGKLGKYALHRNRGLALAPVGFVPPSTQRWRGR